MANEPSPLKSMGTQNADTAHLAAAMAHPSSANERGDRVMRRVSSELERGGRGFAEDSRIADAASWAIEKIAGALGAAARQLRVSATAAVGRPIRNDPVRAVLIAAGVGAVLMALLSMSVRSGARKVQRRVRG